MSGWISTATCWHNARAAGPCEDFNGRNDSVGSGNCWALFNKMKHSPLDITSTHIGPTYRQWAKATEAERCARSLLFLFLFLFFLTDDTSRSRGDSGGRNGRDAAWAHCDVDACAGSLRSGLTGDSPPSISVMIYAAPEQHIRSQFNPTYIMVLYGYFKCENKMWVTRLFASRCVRTGLLKLGKNDLIAKGRKGNRRFIEKRENTEKKDTDKKREKGTFT